MPDFSSALWNKPAAADSTPADPVTRSLRFESGATHRLTKTFGSARSSDKVSTLAFWVKRSKLGSGQHIISANATSHSENTNSFYVQFKSDDTLRVSSYPDPQNNVFSITTSRVFRDVSAWMHIAILIDTDESTAADRLKIYFNGVREPDANLSGTYPTSGATNHLLGKATTTSYDGTKNVEHCIGDEADRYRYKYSGYLADFYFVDGSAIEPVDSFIESAGYGSYKPLEFDMSSYGGNSFHLDMQPAHDAELLVSSVGRNDGDTNFVDVAKGRTITRSGALHKDTVGNPFDSSGTAMYFDGSNDKLTITDSSDFAMGSGAFTYECWVYFHILPSQGYVFGNHAAAGSGVQNAMGLQYKTSSNLAFNFYDSTNSLNYHGDGSGSQQTPNTTVSSGQWYHIACVRSGDTITYYKDGTSWGSTTLSSGASLVDSSEPIYLGTTGYSAVFLGANCSIFDFRITKGTARYTSNFTKPSASFELNPVYIGGDQSGNKNHFTPTNISQAHDVMLDTPTKNYAVLNVLQNTSSSTLTEGNLKSTWSSGSSFNEPATIGATSGKYYFEVYVPDASSTTNQQVGIVRADTANTVTIGASSTNTVAYMANGSGGDPYGQLEYDGNSSAFGSPWDDASHIVQCAFDADTGKVWFGLDNTWQDDTSGNSPDLAAGTYPAVTLSGDEPLIPAIRAYGDYMVFNGGSDPTFTGYKTSGQDTSQSEFYYAPPTGFKSLNTSNLPSPTVTPSEHFNTVLYSGDNTTDRLIDTVGFQPDLLWLKTRTASASHTLDDSVRGAGNTLFSNSTYQEVEYGTNGVDSFEDEGFKVSHSSGNNLFNVSGRNYVAWNWKAHQTPPTPYNYSTTLTLTVKDLSPSDPATNWGTTKLEVFEGTQSLGTVGQPAYDDYDGEAVTVYEIKTDDASKIKVVWKDVDTSSDSGGSHRFWSIYAELENGSTSLALWNGDTWDGGEAEGGYGPPYTEAPETNDVFRAQTSSADESTTGELEVQITVNENSEKYNAAAGFTMFTYTGNSSSDDDTMLFNHSLGVPIDFAICKCRDTASDQGGNWLVWHKDMYDSGYGALYLNQTERENSSSMNTSAWFSNQTVGSQHQAKIRNVTIEDYDGNSDTVRMVDNSKDFVFYGFAGVDSYSKLGKYTGNGSSGDGGPFIYTGFRPAFVLWKRITGGSNSWNIMDNKREGYNPQNDLLFPDSHTNESDVTDQDLLSNGFKLRTSGAGRNADDDTFVYAAFAESPFKYANAR